MIATAIALAAAAAPLDRAFAANETYRSILSEDGLTLSYTPCDDADECIAYVLDCRGDGSLGTGLRITVLGDEKNGPDVRTLAKSLIDRPFGEARISFTVAGAPPVEVGVSAVTVNEDELNGDWDLELQSYDQSNLFDALTKSSSGSVKLDVAGYSMTIADNPKSTADLLGFKAACTK